jgi:von Willebrand factor A domain-containing protein 8
MAINELKAAEMAEHFDERLVILLSDANLDRYGIRPSELRRTLQTDESVNAFIVLIGSLGEQAAKYV